MGGAQHLPTEFRLSRYIIVGAFVFIGAMLLIHFVTLQSVITSPTITSKNPLDIKDLIDKVDTSNQTIFNILLPVFGAWVGVVVAFYFGAEQAKKAQDALKEQAKSSGVLLAKAMSMDEDKLAKHSVSELLTKYPKASEVNKVKLKDKLSDVLKKFDGFSNVVVVNEEDKPLGILYHRDLLNTKTIKKHNMVDDPNNEKLIFENIIKEEIDHDFVTNEKWSTVPNYAELQMNTTLLGAIDRMSKVGKDKVNDVLGLVIEGGKMIGVVTYDMILGYVKGL